MTVGELLTAFPWVAPVEVWTPCGVDEAGDMDYEVSWSQTIVLDKPSIPSEISAKEIDEVDLYHHADAFGERACLEIYTK